MSQLSITLKRVYLPPSPADGTRVLVKRLWPRGLTKDKAAIDHWAKDIAPSPELRKWYGHEPDRWEAFQQRYRKELNGNINEVDALESLCASERVTFVFAAKDEARNSAAVLREYLNKRP
ncbi:MAG: DUF488 family protein [Proteobacteria bacterium]|nr:DUF488 family protein [Pseudomonadota bacterium]MDA1323801.1 DUF488 family protein [Pseudomonadota bacterium]